MNYIVSSNLINPLELHSCVLTQYSLLIKFINQELTIKMFIHLSQPPRYPVARELF